MTTFVTTTIPYVNAAPHLGFALEAVQADTLARHARSRGQTVRLQSGTDDNSLKNVLAAEAAGIPVADYVDANAARFVGFAPALSVAYDDFVRTSADPRHRRGVEALWHACEANGDLYLDTYEGLYCVGCEAYLTEDELDPAGNCPEHATPPQRLAERNWFFRLSRYTDRIAAAITSGELRIEPVGRRNEVLGLLRAGLRDFSISRSQARARGWGIPVPGDPGQVIYVWWDALGNYVTGLGYGAEGADHADEASRADHGGHGGGAGGASDDETDLSRWWTGADRRIHLLGKGVLRFHAVYWPALLLSAGLPLPTDLLVHDYLTVRGAKISKSDGTAIDPLALVETHGVDAVRWWLLRDVPRVGDTDFTEERLVTRAREDLAGGYGNVVNRVVTMLHRFRDGVPPAPAGTVAPPDATKALVEACDHAPAGIDAALAVGDFRGGLTALWTVVAEANRCIEATAPWTLHAAARAGNTAAATELDAVLAVLLDACRLLGRELSAFLPAAAARITAQCTPDGTGRLPVVTKVFG